MFASREKSRSATERRENSFLSQSSGHARDTFLPYQAAARAHTHVSRRKLLLERRRKNTKKTQIKIGERENFMYKTARSERFGRQLQAAIEIENFNSGFRGAGDS